MIFIFRMDSDEHYQKQLGVRLNRDKIKLWEPPYTNTDGSKGDLPQVLFFQNWLTNGVLNHVWPGVNLNSLCISTVLAWL